MSNVCIPLNECKNDEDDSSCYFIFTERNDGSSISHISKLVDNKMLYYLEHFEKIKYIKETVINALEVMSEQELFLFGGILCHYWCIRDDEEIEFNGKSSLINYINMDSNLEKCEKLGEIAATWYLVQPIFLDICKYSGDELAQEVVDNITDVDILYDYLLRLKDQVNFQKRLAALSITKVKN